MESRIVFIDGFCVLCNGLAKYILKKDKNKRLQIASLQGKSAKKHLPQELLGTLETVLYLKNGKVLERSNAVLHILIDLGGYRKLLCVFFIFPKGLRDWVYSGIAKRRYKWFGKNDTCQLPDESSANRILD